MVIVCRDRILLVAEGKEGAVGLEADDAAGGCGWVVERGVVGKAAVYALLQCRVDVGIGGGGGVAGEVGGGTDEGAAEVVEQLLAEGELGNAHAYGAVGGGEVVGDGDREHRGGQDDGGGAQAVEQLEGLGRDVGREHLFGGEDEHGLAVVALLDGVDAFHGIGIGGVAADAPDGVGGVEEGEALAQGGEN